MIQERFSRLGEELARRDRGLAPKLEAARKAAERLHGIVVEAIETFRRTARERGAAHLAHLRVGPVEPDDKHVDCVQVRVQRGAWEALLVAKAMGKVTLVGPYRRGKPERPCVDFALSGEEVERGAVDLVEALIRQASER